MADRPLRPATRRCLGRPLPHQLADRPRAHPETPELSSSGHATSRGYSVLIRVSPGYPDFRGRLLTCYSPVRRSVTGLVTRTCASLDLHALGTPPAFVLSQDQTLQRTFMVLIRPGAGTNSVKRFATGNPSWDSGAFAFWSRRTDAKPAAGTCARWFLARCLVVKEPMVLAPGTGRAAYQHNRWAGSPPTLGLPDDGDGRGGRHPEPVIVDGTAGCFSDYSN